MNVFWLIIAYLVNFPKLAIRNSRKRYDSMLRDLAGAELRNINKSLERRHGEQIAQYKKEREELRAEIKVLEQELFLKEQAIHSQALEIEEHNERTKARIAASARRVAENTLKQAVATQKTGGG